MQVILHCGWSIIWWKLLRKMTGIRYFFCSYNNAYHIKRSSYKLRKLDAEGAVEPDGKGGYRYIYCTSSTCWSRCQRQVDVPMLLYIPRSFSQNRNKTDQFGTWHAILETYNWDQRKRPYKYLENQRENSQTPVPARFYFHLKVETFSFACFKIEMQFKK